MGHRRTPAGAAALALAAVVVLLPCARAQADEPTAVEAWASGMLGGIQAQPAECPADLLPDCGKGFRRCGTVSQPFRALRLDWELSERRFELAALASPQSAWALAEVYSRSYDVSGAEVLVQFDEERDIVRLCADQSLGAPVLSQRAEGAGERREPRRTYRPAGFGGVGKPAVVPGSRLEPAVPDGSVAPGTEVTLMLDASIGADGALDDLRVLRCEPDLAVLREAAIAAVRRWHFEPARLEGRPVAVHYPFRLRFTVP